MTCHHLLRTLTSRPWMWWMAAVPPSLCITTAAVGTRVTQTHRPLQVVTPARLPAPAALTTSTLLMEAHALQRKSTKVCFLFDRCHFMPDFTHHCLFTGLGECGYMQKLCKAKKLYKLPQVMLRN